jgi:hypothetical protein
MSSPQAVPDPINVKRPGPPDHDGVIRLARFVRERLDQSFANLHTKEAGWTGWSRAAAILEALEAVWWLVEGVECGCFPRSHAERVWTERESVIEDLYGASAGVAPQYFSPALYYELANRLSSELAFVQNGRPDFIVVDLFDRALALSSSFVEDRPARQVAAALLLLLNSEWVTVTRKVPDPDQLEHVLIAPESEGERVTFATMIAGFVHITKHMDASNSFYEEAAIRLSRPLSSFVPHLGFECAWRLNFLVSTFSERFSQCATVLAELVSRDAKGSFERSQYNKSMQRLVDRWRANHPLIRFKAASVVSNT